MTCIVLQKYAATQKIQALSKLKLELLLMRLWCCTPRATACGKRGNPGLRPAQANGQQSKDCSPQSRYARRYYAPLRLASQPHFWSEGCKKVWQRTHVSLGAACAAGRGLRSNPEKSGRWLVELARTRQLLDFSLVPDGSLLLKTKLAEIACKRVQAGSPAGIPKG